MTLFGLDIERYLSIVHPFYHRTKVTKSKLLKILVCFWLLIVAIVVGILAFGEVMNLIIRFVLAFNALSTSYIYLAIYITAQRRQRVTEPREMEELHHRGASTRRTDE